MKLPDWTALAMNVWGKGIPHKKLLLCLLPCALTGMAQPVVAPAPEVDYSPAAVRRAANGVDQPAAPRAASELSPFQWGPVTLHPHFLYRFLYGDGIQASPGRQTTTAVHSLSPGLLLNLGTRWTLDYTPTKTYYSSPEFRDTLDHAINLAGRTTYEDLTLQFSQTYATSSTPLIETGQQTDLTSYGTVLNAAYRLGRQMQWDTVVSHQARFFDNVTIPDNRDWSVTERLHFQFSPRLDTALSVAMGYVSVDPGADMTYTRPQAQITWQATDKLNLNLEGGFENRKFLSGGAADLNNPTLSASIDYRPFKYTTLNFTASQDVTVSYFQNQVTENTRWSVNLQQRLFQHFQLSGGLTQQKTSYVATINSVSAGRDDQSYSFNVRLSTTFFQRGTIAVLYQNSHNTSSAAGYGFSSNQFGFEIGYRY